MPTEGNTTNAVPAPGSDAALARGCTCPVLDNSHGAGWLCRAGAYWISEGCPVHDPRPQLIHTANPEAPHGRD